MGDASPVDLSVRDALTLTVNQGYPLGYPEGQHILEVIPGSYSCGQSLSDCPSEHLEDSPAGESSLLQCPEDWGQWRWSDTSLQGPREPRTRSYKPICASGSPVPVPLCPLPTHDQ